MGKSGFTLLRYEENSMAPSTLEHVNITVSDPEKTATLLCTLFDWHIRWHGDAKNGGTTYHVGSADSYVAVYAENSEDKPSYDSYHTCGGLNHIGVVVDDLDEVEQRVRTAGFTPHSHADYEPGKRFYFDDTDGIEFEVVSY
jgi:catechol 2,3-dioxygenase-like lactoylglutathione lyase family enzyme